MQQLVTMNDREGIKKPISDDHHLFHDGDDESKEYIKKKT